MAAVLQRFTRGKIDSTMRITGQPDGNFHHLHAVIVCAGSNESKTKGLQLVVGVESHSKMRCPQKESLMRATVISHSSSSMDPPITAYKAPSIRLPDKEDWPA
jgi:hypothetical protein